jgi:hypothetical protein
MRAGLFLIASEPVLLELDLQTSRPPPPLTVWHAAAGNIPPLAAHATPFSFPVAPATGPCPSPASQPAAPCLVHTTQAGDALRRPNGAPQAHPLQLEPAAPCPIPASRAGSRRPTGFPRASPSSSRKRATTPPLALCMPHCRPTSSLASPGLLSSHP